MKEILPPHLPPSWQQVPLEYVIVRMSNGITKRQTKDGQGFAVSRIETISQGVIDFSRVGFLNNLLPSEVENYTLHPGDILFSHINSDLHLGKTAVVSMNADSLLHGMNLLLIRVDQKKVLPVFLHWLFNYYRVGGLFMSIAQHAVNQSSINQAKLKNLAVILPPLDEQCEIVAEIEKQFTRLEAGVADLRRVQANLKRYRAAVLKAACEGKLVPTEAELAKEREKVAAASRRWSSDDQRRRDASATISEEIAGADENQSRDGSATQEGRGYETGAQLLERILTERRQNWQGRGQYKEPDASDSANLPQLPDGWIWTNLDAAIVSGPQNGVYLPRELYGRGHPIMRIDDYQDGWVRGIDDLNKVAADPVTATKYQLLSGDLMINRVNSLTHLGKCLIVRETHAGALFESNMMKAHLADCVNPRYVEFCLRSRDGRTRLTSGAKWAVNQASINQEDVKRTPIPLPPLAGQTRIVAEVERRLSVVEELEAVVSANLQRATRLRQSILQQAFEGKLLTAELGYHLPVSEEFSLAAETAATHRRSR